MPSETFTYDWSRFVKRIQTKATISDAYTAWTTQHGLERWFLRDADFATKEGTPRDAHSFVKPGDTYKWLWHGYDDTTAETGEVLEGNGTDTFKFVFGTAGIVTITIKTEQGETIVELLQENIPTDEKHKVYFHLGCSTGWTFYLANLKSVLEGGLDLRNKNAELKNVVSA